LSLDDYFDQLDAAFSNLQPSTPIIAESSAETDWAVVAMPDVTEPAPPGAMASDAAHAENSAGPQIALPDPAAADVFEKLNMEVPVPADEPFLAPISAHVQAEERTEPVALTAEASMAEPETAPSEGSEAPLVTPSAAEPAAAAAAPAAGAPKSNPFANLSAVKAEAAARAAAAAAITDELIENIVSRVLQRMSDKVVRETVAGIVSETAERLVQEEIERIKSSGS
jgi:hypothetical protein